MLFHGVGGDWIVFDAGEFEKVLDGLVERRDSLWITDHISEYQYEAERKTARVEAITVGDRQIQLKVTTDADQQWFDYPLTLLTKVPPDWTKCQVSQGNTTTALFSSNGVLQYDAIPDGTPVTLKSLTTR